MIVQRDRYDLTSVPIELGTPPAKKTACMSTKPCQIT